MCVQIIFSFYRQTENLFKLLFEKKKNNSFNFRFSSLSISSGKLIENDRTMEFHQQQKSEHLKKQQSNELLEAARTGNEEALLAALKKYDVNCQATDGRRSTPLHLASGYNRIRVVEILLRNGADVNSKDQGGLYL